MIDAKENPHTANVGANVQVTEARNKPQSNRPRITLSQTAERWISEWACALVTGQVELWQLPASLREFYTYANESGRESVTCDRCDRLRWERDLYYFQLSNPGKTGADFYASKTRALWDQGVAA